MNSWKPKLPVICINHSEIVPLTNILELTGRCTDLNIVILNMTHKNRNHFTICQDNNDGDSSHPTNPNKRSRGPDKKPRKSGPEHGLFKHGQGKTREYDPKMLSAWKEGVLRKDHLKCFITGQTRDLQAHHLESWDSALDKRYDISNGITLTKKIHQEFHSMFGWGGNNRIQFERFAKERYSITNFPWQHGNHDPSFTIEEIAAFQATQKEKKKVEFLELLKSRQHRLICSENGFTAKANVYIYCEKHEMEHSTTVTNYKKSITGMPCCGRQLQSEKGTWEHVNKMKRKQANNHN